MEGLTRISQKDGLRYQDTDVLQGSAILPILNFHLSFPWEGPRNSGVEV